MANDWESGRRLNAPLKASAFDAAYTFFPQPDVWDAEGCASM